ncbi:MAG: mreC [Bacillota bacterium]|nr:mreC [Bacillota bacterium]
MNWLREHRVLSTILSIFFILIVIMAISYSHVGSSTVLGRSVQKVTALVQEPFSDAGNGIRSGLKGIFQFRSILKENEELKKQISDLNRQIIQNKLTEAELAELRNLSNILGYDQVASTYDLVTADVIAMDGSNWFNLFTINAGTDDGIYRDAVVINGDGLIGRVLETGPNWSKIISVIDESNSVSFKVFRDMQLLGILSGDGKGALDGYMIDPEAAVIEGDVLITSGIGMYPAGIPIGKVKEVIWNNDTLLKTITIDPSAYFKNLQKVTVLVKKQQD